MPEPCGKRSILDRDAPNERKASEHQKRDEADPVTDGNAEPEKCHNDAGIRRVAKIAVGAGCDEPMLLPHDDAGIEKPAKCLDRPEAERDTCPNERNADGNRFAVHRELRQNMRNREDAEHNCNAQRGNQECSAAAILKYGARIAPLAYDEPYLDDDPRPITDR